MLEVHRGRGEADDSITNRHDSQVKKSRKKYSYLYRSIYEVYLGSFPEIVRF